MAEQRKIWQPLDTSIRAELDPEYVAFHDEFAQFVRPDDSRPWDPEIRTVPRLPYTGIGPAPVGSTEDVPVGECAVRVFTPEGENGGGGWPLLVWFHGGGFVSGDAASDVDFLTRVCSGARCVVATVDYRLAPEHPYPACLNDGAAALRWLSDTSPGGGGQRFAIETSRIAIGGTSSGGLISLVTAMGGGGTDEAQPVPPLVFQLLVCPIVDNTATEASPGWQAGLASPWLTPSRMLWFRRLWLPGWTPAAPLEWPASPNLAPDSALARLPPTWMAIPQRDLLAPEGLELAGRIRAAGVAVTTVVYEGCPHPLITLPARMAKSRQLYKDAVEALTNAMWGTQPHTS